MKKYLTLLLLAFYGLITAQFQDDFLDGNFSTAPAWTGEDTHFEINGSNQLHLNAPSMENESTLVVVSDASIDGFWEFYVELQFNPSSSNKAYIYLISDQENLENNLNGYFVLVGNTADEVSLYKQSGTTEAMIIDGIDGIVGVSNPRVKIKVVRDAIGNFELFTDTSVLFDNYITQGAVFDDTFLNSNYFGVRCDYTSSRSDKFLFDDFNITAQEYIDVFPPEVSSLEVINLNTLEIIFSEELEQFSAENLTNYNLNNDIGYPISSDYNNSNNSVLLTFSTTFNSGLNYSLAINDITDISSNSLNTTEIFSIKNAYSFQSIVINEILADETPSNGLPFYEFIELKNLQNDTLFTEGWFLSDLTDTTYFNTDTILPNEFVIVGKTTAETFYEGFATTFGLTNFISLNNTEDKLTLYNKYGAVIDSLYYYKEWFGEATSPTNELKKEGGWSLERINDSFNCSASFNWIPSVGALGGTPGEENSIHSIIPDYISPTITSAYIINDSTVQVTFSQEVGNALDATYEIVSIDGDQVFINSISNVYQEGNSYFIVIANEIFNALDNHLLEISNLQNCYTDEFEFNNISLYYLKEAQRGDFFINEILFNPYTGGADYIEIYNSTEFAFNLKGFQFIENDLFEQDTVSDFSLKISENLIIEPFSYLVFSEDSQTVLSNYIVSNPSWLIELNIPNFSDKEGILAFIKDTIVYDKLHYFSRWHFELLDSENGVSLEKINSIGITQDNNNWASAAKSFGFGTPTAKNSQSYPEINQEDLITVTPDVFSPNQDGDKDFAIINYEIETPGYIANASIFDVIGRKIKDIAIHETIGSNGFWKWDGTNLINEKAKTGIYIIMIDLFDLDGNKKHFEEKIVLY